MRFHCIFPVRDERDIIEQIMDHTLAWCDAIYVLDTGSTDGTWEVIEDYAARDARVVPLAHKPVYYSEGLRAYVFSQVRDRAEDGDWFLRMDADEFYDVPPPQFVRERVGRHETCLANQAFEFCLTAKDMADWEAGRETLADRKRPIEDRRRYCRIFTYWEPRFFRYRRAMQWTPDCSFPFNAGLVAKARIPQRHYPHRDPLQLQRRCALRSVVGGFPHWEIGAWREFVVDAEKEKLFHWQPGTPLPDVNNTNHIAPWPKRAAQRFVHGCLLPMLDRKRPTFPASYVPKPIPDDVTRRIVTAMDEIDEAFGVSKA